ncbi:hypothetical protein B296_00004695 [Ensete ventricosum]|uniref:Uncharacterized protein n=1 Tax=Ensete ventricosum TaxID=4639 RepID=A0A427B816_ENSVE|nr:hypothetical protein B296_00004695 [Ensete ventricosum]
MPPCLLSKHCWFRPVCASSPAVISAQRAFIVINGYGAPVPEVLTTPVAYHVVVLRRSFRGPCGEVRGVPPVTGKVGLAPPYLCQVGRMTADPPMLVSGRAQSRRVGHVVGPAVRGRRDVAARSTFVISLLNP